MDPKPDATRGGLADIVLNTLMIALPIAAIGAVSVVLVSVFGVMGFGGWPAIVVAVPLAIAAVAGFILIQGNDAMDCVVGSVLILLFCLLVFPVVERAQENALRRKERGAISAPAGRGRD